MYNAFNVLGKRLSGFPETLREGEPVRFSFLVYGDDTLNVGQTTEGPQIWDYINGRNEHRGGA